jgi:Protein of unknown function (DUF3997)
MKFKYKYIVFLIISLYGCNGMKEELIFGKFYLIELDYIKEDRTLSYSLGDSYIGVIDKTVFAVGYDENYIIAKQHPNNNKRITNYFIVDSKIKDKYWIEKGVFGPFTLSEFKKKKRELNISVSVKFTKEYNDYE